MKSFSIQCFIIITLMSFAPLIFAQPVEGIDVTIRFFEKRIYYLNQTDIAVKISLTNNGTGSYRFKIASNRFFNLDFDVKTPTNLTLPHAEKFITERSSRQHVFYREVSIEPGEEYSFTEILNEYVKFEQAGLYTIQAVFYPELAYQGSTFIRSNKLSLSIRPPVVSKEMQAVIEVETGKALEREQIPPDEVVTYMLHARQKSQWEKFFLYLDLKSLFLQNYSRANRFKKASQEAQQQMLEDFRNSLMLQKIEQAILAIPTEFEILKTEYRPLEGSVVVLEKFRYSDYTDVKEYTYTVRKYDQYWLISGYTVVPIRTE
ncbi:MAG: hypothetical protein JW881_08160 [Spirochaetales bacterium]|nr:hypothetical protein [Spirochaetales bacterium]